MRIAVFDASHDRWRHPGQARVMTTEVTVWQQDGGDANPFIGYGHSGSNTATRASVSDDQFVKSLADEEVARGGSG